MTLHFFTAEYDERAGRWVYTVPVLGRRYLRKWFWIDLVRVRVHSEWLGASPRLWDD